VNRRAAISAFLAEAGWSSAGRRPIAGDASFRHYERLYRDGESAILMDAPPEKEDVRPFLAVGRLLCEWGFSAPGVLAQDIGNGLLLLEDLGEDSFSAAIVRDSNRERGLYENAVDLLVALHESAPPPAAPVSPPDPASWPLVPYDAGPLFAELHLFTDWYLPALRGDGEPAEWRALLDPLWRPLIEEAAANCSVLTLRDYHADNLFWLPAREGVRRVGLLDFQDALIGHPAYDLVSLLQDSRRDIADELESAMIARYLDGRAAAGSPLEAERFLRGYRILGAQRSAKVIGIFTRLCRRDGKPGYLMHLPRVWRRLEANLAAGGFSALEGALERLVPHARRRTPPSL